MGTLPGGRGKSRSRQLTRRPAAQREARDGREFSRDDCRGRAIAIAASGVRRCCYWFRFVAWWTIPDREKTLSLLFPCLVGHCERPYRGDLHRVQRHRSEERRVGKE